MDNALIGRGRWKAVPKSQPRMNKGRTLVLPCFSRDEVPRSRVATLLDDSRPCHSRIAFDAKKQFEFGTFLRCFDFSAASSSLLTLAIDIATALRQCDLNSNTTWTKSQRRMHQHVTIQTEMLLTLRTDVATCRGDRILLGKG